MYVSGHISNFEPRLHQLPTGQDDLNLFITEGNGYLTPNTSGVIPRWNKEIAKRASILLGNWSYYVSGALPVISINNPLFGRLIADADGVEPWNVNIPDQSIWNISYAGYSFISALNCTQLNFLDCYYNYATSLDVNGATALTYLNCSNNALTSLDVSSNTALVDLNCADNLLSSLDVSSNTALTTLGCSSNQLTSLDISSNTALEYLYCGSNQLASLDISFNTALVDLDCSNNLLTAESIENILVALDNFGNVGVLNIMGNTMSYTSAALYAKDSLIAKGWLISSDY